MNQPGAEPDAAVLSQSDIHDVLRNDRRRLVLERLTDVGPESVSDLAEEIGAVESGESPPPRNVRQSVYVSLHQTHLPKLDELGIVVYDDDEKTVTLAENADEVLEYMAIGEADGDEADWIRTYAALSGVAVLGGVIALVGALVPAVDPVALAGAVVATLGAGAGGAIALRRRREDADAE
jgi:predicted transcriptional regulator